MPKTYPKRLEDFGKKYVPLLRTYLQREETRDLDKVIRDELVKKIQGLINQINGAKQTLVDNKVLAGLDLLDRSTRKLDKIRDSIRFAARGYSGVFDLEVMGDDQLKRLLEFDQSLFDQIAILEAGLSEVSGKSTAELKASLSVFDQKIKEFETRLDERDAYARERQSGK